MAVADRLMAGSSSFRASIDPESLKKLEFAIGKEAERISAGVRHALTEAAEAAVAAAKENCPVDTGFLRDSIDVVYSKDGETATVGPQNKKAWYGVFVEWGSSERPAHPFMTPAVELAREQLRKSLIDNINHAEGGVE